MNQLDENERDQYLSKSQRKREVTALGELGKQLTKISDSLLAKLTLPDNLLEGIELYKRLPNKHGAKRRQLQFIAKLMRDIDATEIQSVLAQSKQKVELEKRKFQQLENIREELIDGNKATFDTLISQHPDIDIQHIRQLIRQSRKEQLQQKPPVTSRKLFKYLREVVIESNDTNTPLT